MVHQNVNYIFVIMFVTLGPLKVIPVFHALAHNADEAWRRQLALRAFLVATIIVAFIAFFAIELLVKWRLSIEALVIAGGILLFLSAAEKILKFQLVDIPAKENPVENVTPLPPRPAPRWMAKPVLEPLAIPAIVTPTAVVAILFFLAQARDDAAQYWTVLAILALILVLNLICMLAAHVIMRAVGVATLQVVGWILSVLQAGLAVQFILAAVKSAGLTS